MIVDRYYYNQLNESEQAIYRAFYDGVKSHKDIIPIPVKGKFTEDVFNKIFAAITRDNPLIYYLNQSACNMAQDMFGHVAICPQYFFDKAKVKEYNRKIEETVNALAAQMELTKGNDYEKAQKVHDWLCMNVEYDMLGADMNEPVRVITSHNIIGVFAYHRAQCEGIAKAVKVLLNAVDVRCIVATGVAHSERENGPHAWNIVNLDNTPYHMDVTWDIGANGKLKDRMAYDYFCITDEMLGIDHVPDDNLPKCDSDEMNFFVKNKCFFKTKVQVMAYVAAMIRRGHTDLYFRVSPQMNIKLLTNDIGNLAMRELANKGHRGIKIQQRLNEKMGICWIGIY